MRSHRSFDAGRPIALLALVAGACADAVAPTPRSTPAPTRPLAAIAPATIGDLGWGGTGSLFSQFALDISNPLETAGSQEISDGRFFAVWSDAIGPDVNATYLGDPSISESATNAIANDRGMVGHATSDGGIIRGFVYPATGGGIWVSDTRQSVAYDINSNGAGASYVGWIEESVGSGIARAFVRGVDDATEVIIPTLFGGTYNAATGINENEQVVGYSEVSGGAVYAFLHGGGTTLPLPPLSGGNNSVAWGLNNAASPRVVGYSDNAAGQVRAVQWVNGSVSLVPGDLGGGNSIALDVNNQGDIIGYAMDAAGNWKPFIYRQGNPSMEQLVLQSRSTWGIATGLTDRTGTRTFIRIVGYAEMPDGVDRTRPVYWDLPYDAPYTP